MEMTYKHDDRSVRSDARPFSTDPADAAQKARENGGQEAGSLLTDAQDLIGDGTDRVQRQARAAMATSDRYVHEQPWQSVGIAAGVGLLVGFLIARR
jgi:ElaB/YqjD/DUF883 family membrane-anchored ribosome-binding protein